ncbi:hypothetical protein DsansV1_C02g0023001 [Dioscorea sansibarensis]
MVKRCGPRELVLIETTILLERGRLEPDVAGGEKGPPTINRSTEKTAPARARIACWLGCQLI